LDALFVGARAQTTRLPSGADEARVRERPGPSNEDIDMCRWIAYSGPPLQLGVLLTRPDHSLIDQSIRAEQGTTTNGDGFGMGWYVGDAVPGRYRDTQPAWNDRNLTDLADHIRSPLFLAHVRASSGTPVQRTNCHPFRFGRWLFQHNGAVADFARVERDLLLAVDPTLFQGIEGSTDSETLFHLALTYGLDDDPLGALERTIGHVERLLHEAGVDGGITFSAAAADGRRLIAVRYATGGDSPSLYHSRHVHALRVVDGSYEVLPEGAVVLVSEPLDELSEHWVEVPESSSVSVGAEGARISGFRPRS